VAIEVVPITFVISSRAYGRDLRQKPFFRQHTLRGEQAQVDWGHLGEL
jgi:hypothetical protein